MRYKRMFLCGLLVLLSLSGVFVAAASQCDWDPVTEVCNGACEPGEPDCDRWYGCGCSICEPWQEGYSLELVMTRDGGSGPPLSVGSAYSGSLAQSTGGTIQNRREWGTAIDAVPAVSDLQLTAEVRQGGNSVTRRLVITSLYARIPTFVHSRTSPDSTGDNVFALFGGLPSVLTLNTQTGAVTGTLYTTMTNAFYGANDRIGIEMDVTGTFDFNAMRLTLDLGGTGMLKTAT